MTNSVPIYDEIFSYAHPMVAPIFLHDFLFRTGRSASTPTATAIFVRRRGVLYVVTCQHVIEQLSSERVTYGHTKGVLSLAVENGAIMLGTPKQSCFASPVQSFGAPDLDVAIARLSWSDWDLLNQGSLRRRFVDFDNYAIIDYGGFSSCAAVGLPDRSKRDEGGRIKSNIVVAVAGLTRPISVTDSAFQLYSKLDQPHGVAFSGLSGGLVLGISSPANFTPIGLIFEGGPSGEETEANLIGLNDIFFRCHHFNPETFDCWIEATNFPEVNSMFTAVA